MEYKKRLWLSSIIVLVCALIVLGFVYFTNPLSGEEYNSNPEEVQTAYTWTPFIEDADTTCNFVLTVKYQGEYSHLKSNKQYVNVAAYKNINGALHMIFEYELDPKFDGSRDDYDIDLSYIPISNKTNYDYSKKFISIKE